MDKLKRLLNNRLREWDGGRFVFQLLMIAILLLSVYHVRSFSKMVWNYKIHYTRQR
jgi:hypothetical protein